MNFQRGSYGEIIPVYQTDDISRQNRAGKPIDEELLSTMTQSEREALYHPALSFDFQKNVWQVLSKAQINDPLYRAILRGEPLSLYPHQNNACQQDGHQKDAHHNGTPAFCTFAPVLRRIGDELWQLGIPEAGRCTILTGEISSILPQAWLLCAIWAEAESAGLSS